MFSALSLSHELYISLLRFKLFLLVKTRFRLFRQSRRLVIFLGHGKSRRANLTAR